jgi:cysteine desulfurase/selenocysteine lyase
MSFDVEHVRADFPILRESYRGKPLVYLDNAATTQKPRAVIDAVSNYYETSNANVHRALYWLGARATDAYEGARAKVQRFLNAPSQREIIFVRGATEAINLVAASFARPRLQPGDEILVSHMEHHSNIVPWQIAAQSAGAVVRPIPITDAGEIDLDAYASMLGPRTRMVAVVHVSNALGTINPVEEIVRLARERGVPTLLDGAQATAHVAVDVQKLGCDFYAFSGHKLYGPTGIGALWGREAHLRSMPPYHGGGDMIREVKFEGTTYADLPNKFEAGTPDISGVVGLGAAIDYVSALGLDAIAAYEDALTHYALERLRSVPGFQLVGDARRRGPVVSFALGDVHPHDVATVLDMEGVAIRAGHHCAQPVLDRFGLPATARASFAIYNTRAEIDALVAALHKVVELFGR